jgi:ComF family protein
MGIISKFIDIIYPKRCNICHNFLPNSEKHGDNNFCLECLESFLKISPPLCPICGIPFDSFLDEDHLCENCLRKRPFYDSLGAPYLYQGGVMDAIHQMKYAGKSYFAKSLGLLLGCFAYDWINDSEGILMMAVPLHPKKLRERGFNQSLLLAKAILPILGTELDFLSLRRVIYTRPQTGLKSDERKKNVRNAFELVGRKDFKGRNVLLIDDVATTGNTMNECARVLKKAGCNKISCLALARTKTMR